MGNVIDFLERLGQDAQLRYATGSQVEEALEQAQIDPAIRAAILAADPRRLEALLGAQANVCCLVRPGEEEDEESEEDEDDDDDDDDDGDDEVSSQRASARRVAAPL